MESIRSKVHVKRWTGAFASVDTTNKVIFQGGDVTLEWWKSHLDIASPFRMGEGEGNPSAGSG